MRIHLDNVVLSARTGPNVFASRLCKSLFSLGHDVVLTGNNADVSLVFIEPSGNTLANKVIQRIDGIWFAPNQFYSHNVHIKNLYDRTDAVMFQSEFDKKMVTKWWGDPRLHEVVNNGIDVTPIKELTITGLIDLRKRYETLFVCSSNWHPQKRLQSNIDLFFHLRKTCCPNSCLIVLGSNPNVWTQDPHVVFAGSQPPEVYMQVFAAANWMLHLAYIDHSPNVVTEALSQGTPVICADSGGTKELVGDFGIVLKEAKQYELELLDYDKPPVIDFSHLTSLPDKHQLGQHADIDIDIIAKRYVALFERVLA